MVPDFDLFAVYRRLLLILVGTYTVIRLVLTIWRWRGATATADLPEALLRRWVESSLLRVRARRFKFDGLQLALLTGILAFVFWLHAARPFG